MEEALTKYRGDIDFRLNALEQAGAPVAEEPAAVAEEDEPLGGRAEPSAVDQPDTGDPAEDAYLVGYRLWDRSEEHTSELQSLMRISYSVFCLKKKNKTS